MKSSGKTKKDAFVLLHDVRSVYNVGSVFRTADCLGITGIILSGYTPEPVDRFGRPRKDFAKVALGAEVSVPWKKFNKFSEACRFFKKSGVQIIALEQSNRSVGYRKIKPKYPAVFVFGNEVSGLPKSVIEKCDVVAEIPMSGVKESLNVSVAAGIALAVMLGR